MSDPLVDFAIQLYNGPPEQFVARRNARAAEAPDRDTAERIRALRKPTVAAWVVNVFASERAAHLQEALRLADELREAQADLDAATLAQLGRQRRALTTRLAAEAAEVAIARGGRITDSTREAVRQTISAAFFSADAAAAVSSGRLIRELAPSDDLDLSDVVGGGPPVAARVPAAPADEVAARRERRRAEKAVQDAEHALSQAERDLSSAERELREASRRNEELTARIAELEDELGAARTQQAQAQDRMARSTQQLSEASSCVDAAAQAVAAARRTRDALKGARS